MGVRSASQALPSVTLSLRFLTEAATPLELRLRTLRAKKALFRAPSRISSTEHIRRGELVLSLCHASSERPVIVCAREKNLPRPAHGRVLRESSRREGNLGGPEKPISPSFPQKKQPATACRCACSSSWCASQMGS